MNRRHFIRGIVVAFGAMNVGLSKGLAATEYEVDIPSQTLLTYHNAKLVNVYQVSPYQLI